MNVNRSAGFRVPQLGGKTRQVGYIKKGAGEATFVGLGEQKKVTFTSSLIMHVSTGCLNSFLALGQEKQIRTRGFLSQNVFVVA